MTGFRRRVRTTPAFADITKEGRCFNKERGKGPLWYWSVKVYTAPHIRPYQQRLYHLIAETDNMAAFEGLRLFAEELDFVTIEV